MMRRRGAFVLVGTWLLATACEEPQGGGGSSGDAGSFAESARIELEELPGDPIVGIDQVGTRPGGGFLVADRQAGRVRLFDDAGRQVRVVGRPGEGPGELGEPDAAVEFPDGEVAVLQRASPRLTIFRPDTAPRVMDIPGQYGFWAAPAGSGFVAGVATRETRFTVFEKSGIPSASFGRRDPSVAATPFWIYFAADHAAVLGDRIAVNTSLFPSVRIFSLEGDSLSSFPLDFSNWRQADPPPVSDLRTPGNRERLEEWARTFTVVRQVAAVDDSLLVVEYGQHDPRQADPYFVFPTTADVYTTSGTRLVAGLKLPGPVVGGGKRLLVLVAEPPNAWTIAALEWVGPKR